jgi:hypothetical protein
MAANREKGIFYVCICTSACTFYVQQMETVYHASKQKRKLNFQSISVYVAS